MVSEKANKIEKSRKNLIRALEGYGNSSKDDELPFLTVCKSLEVLFEYVWKELKNRVEEEGLFAVSPKEAIRQAARLEKITEPERWIAITNARNDSVHDYFGIPKSKYVELAAEFVKLIDFMKS